MPPMINLMENKLKAMTDADFVEFIDEAVQVNTPYDKAMLLEEFKRLCPNYRNLSGISFKKWIDIWAAARGYLIRHYKSNGNAMMIISPDSPTNSSVG